MLPASRPDPSAPAPLRRRTIRASVSTALFALAQISLPMSAAAQAPPESVTGVVFDAITGQPVSAALISLGDGGARAIANVQGRFTLANVPRGSQRLRVTRIGYRDLEVTVNVTASPAPLELRMEASPISLDELTVRGNARADMVGSVVDDSGRPISWADVTLTRDAVNTERIGAANEHGIFNLDDVVSGSYLLLVERLGYASQYVRVSHTPQPTPIEVRLEPDSAEVRGLAVMNGEMNLRRDSYGRDTRAFDENRIRASPLPDMRQFMEFTAGVPVIPWNDPLCNRPAGPNCVEYRGRVFPPVVYIDEARALDVMDIDAYPRQEIYRLDYFDCPGKGATLRAEATVRLEIRAYTRDYMKRMAGRPRILVPPCIP